MTEALLAFLATLAGLGDSWASQRLEALYTSGGSEIRKKFLALGFEMGSTEMLSISANHLLEVPISEIRLLMAGRWRRELTHSLSLPGVPDWFCRITTAIESHRVVDEQSHPSADLGIVRIGLHVSRIGENEIWDSMDVTGIPADHWISKVHQFSSSPSTASLAAAASAVDEAGANLRLDSPLFPWPVAAALQSLDSGTVTHEDLSKPSIVGDLQAWRSIEASWTGILGFKELTGDLADSIQGSHSFLPYAAASGRFVGNWSDESSSQWISTPCDAISECRSNVSRAGLAHLILTVAVHGRRHDKVPKEEIQYLKTLTEYSLAHEGSAELGWLSRLKSLDDETVLWLDHVGKKAAGRIWLFRAPAAAFRAWVSDFSLTGLGAILCSADLSSLNRTAQGKVRREWKDVRAGIISDARRCALASLAISSFAPCADMDDWRDRLSALAGGVRVGAFQPDEVVGQIHLSHDPLQQKLILAFLDSLDGADGLKYDVWERAYERLVSDQISVLTNIDFASTRV
ncbi:hypothetical protein [Kitasatospora sp. SUK 42]|uniref:hypothetical protein n=1 Tax=Kitasatospora sp. SUK 42 TaxID=1588882 RepID=UPI0018CAAA75|nr:hypothetical protein [Kitasatospora sp. SUK 42]